MKRLSLSFCVAALLVLAGCQDKAPDTAAAPASPRLEGSQMRYPAGHPQLAQLGVVQAAPARTLVVELPARLVWNEERTQRIAPAFAGRVARITADVGQPVQPGTLLAQLASPDFGVAQAEAAKARVDAGLTQKSFARQKELYEAGVIARKDLDLAEAEAARAGAELQRAQARTSLYGGGAGIDQRLALVAGIPGIVVERNLTPGQELRPDQMGPGTPPLFVVSDPSSLWVQIDARETEAGTLRPGASFELVVPSLPGETFEGRVTAASDFIDPATRTIKVRGVVPNRDRRLKAEMLATARVERTPGAGVVVPAAAVALRGTQHWVMVQVQPGAFEPRDVVLGWQGPREVLVQKGLEAGEQVVAENLLLLARQYRNLQDAAIATAAPPEDARRQAAASPTPPPAPAR